VNRQEGRLRQEAADSQSNIDKPSVDLPADNFPTHMVCSDQSGGMDGRSDVLTVPWLPAGISTYEAALAYAARGWYVLPVDPGTKHAGSILGCGWPSRSTRDPGMIRFLFHFNDRALALHVGRSGGLVFDVDDQNALPEILAGHLQEHHGPYQSTRIDAPGRGHYAYRQPPGVPLGNGKGRLQGSWGDVRGANGIIVVEPTPHQKQGSGGRYHWIRVGICPPLPGALHAALVPGPQPPRTGVAGAMTRVPLDGQGGRPRRLSLIDLVKTILESVEGERNSAVFWAACRAGELIAAGLLDRGVAVRALFAAGLEVGLSSEELIGHSGAGGTIASGLSTGKRGASL